MKSRLLTEPLQLQSPQPAIKLSPSTPPQGRWSVNIATWQSPALINLSRLFGDKLIILIFPVLITVINSNWVYSPVSNYLPDPWFYLGYFRYFFDYAPAYPSNIHYFVERLTWNIPGYFLHHILSPLTANYALHLLVCYIALYSLYGILNRLFGNRTALLSAVLMCGYPWFLRAVGWDYVDGVGIALMLLALYLLTEAKNSNSWKSTMVLAGCVHASLLITNLFWVGMAPSWIAYYLLINSPVSKDKSVRIFGDAVYFLIGNLITTFFCAFTYYIVTGNYFFLNNSINFSVSQSQSEILTDFINSSYGAFPATWHILPLVLALSSIRQFAARNGVSYNSFNLFQAGVFVFFILGYAWLIFWHFTALPYLVIFLYCSFTIPGTFLLLGWLLDKPLNQIAHKQFTHITLLTALTLLLPFYLVTQFPKLENLQGNTWLIATASILAMICIIQPWQKRSIAILVLSLSLLSFLNGGNAYVFNPDANNGRDHFLAIIKASDIVDSSFPNRTYSTFRFWYRTDENYETFFSLSSLYLYPWGSSLNRIASDKDPSPVLALHKTDQFQDGDNIVILSSNSNTSQVLLEANDALIQRNAQVAFDAHHTVTEGAVTFELYFIKIKLNP